MGQAKSRGTPEDRLQQAIAAGRVQPTSKSPEIPLLREHWIAKGSISPNRPIEDSLYIKPILESITATGPSPRQTLVLDNNVLTDLLENRQPANTAHLVDLLKTNPIELNPLLAMMEQRQKFGGASEAMTQYRDFLSANFGRTIADTKVRELDQSLERMKPALIRNIELLSGYLPQIVYLYHRDDLSAAQKLRELIKVIVEEDLPNFQTHYYFAALVFMAREHEELFNAKDLEKLREDMKVGTTVDKQWVKIRSLSNDLAFLGLALSHSGVASGAVYPYLATRDRMSQLLLSELTCKYVAPLTSGMANGYWAPHTGRGLDSFYGSNLELKMPKRVGKRTTDQERERRSKNLRSVCDRYVQKSVEAKLATLPPAARA